MLASAAPAADRRVLGSRPARPNAPGARARRASVDRLAVIDYSLPSTQPRLWVFDLDRGRLLFEELVAHGRGTGERLAEHFSNVEGSQMSSLGLFRAADTYDGANGYSLRLHGLEPGFNDRALERAIVMHGAPYVSEDSLASTGGSGAAGVVRRFAPKSRDA